MKGNFGRGIVRRSLIALTTVVTTALAGGSYAAAQFDQFHTAVGGANWDGGNGATVTTQDGGIIRLPNGNTVSVGETRSFGATYDVYVAELDPCGDLVQSYVFDLQGRDDHGRKIRLMPNGDYIIVGYTGTSELPANRDAFLMRVTSTGVVVWAKTYGGSSHDEGKDVRVSGDAKDIYACGLTRGAGAGDYDGWIWSVSSANGNFNWSKVYGGLREDRLNALDIGCHNSIIATGGTRSYSSLPNQYRDIWVVKVNPLNGALTWSFRHWGSGNTEGKGIAVSADGAEFSVVGYTENISAAGMQEYIGVFNCSDGALIQETAVGDDPGHEACLNDVQYEPAGGLLVAGTWRHNNTFRVHRMRATNGGFPLLSMSYAGVLEKEYGYSVAWTNDWNGDGQYDIGMVGATLSMGAGLGDMYVIGTDPYGVSKCNEKEQPYLLYLPFLTQQWIMPKVNDYLLISDINAVGRAVNAVTPICTECGHRMSAPEEDGGKLSQGMPAGNDVQAVVVPLRAVMQEGAITR